MTKKLTLSSLTQNLASLHDVVISDPDNAESRVTRRILRWDKHSNPSNPSAFVSICLMHQKRHKGHGSWKDADSFDLRTLNAGEDVRLDLHSAETLKLFEALQRLYDVPPKGFSTSLQPEYVLVRRDEHIELSDEARAMVNLLVDSGGPQLLSYIASAHPGLVEDAAIVQQHKTRLAAVDEFEQHIESLDWDEGEWENFFKRERWIFGHNLAYQFLSTVQPQAHVGGTDLSGSGALRVDQLMKTEADARFVVVVDIKKPDTKLLNDRPYRPTIYRPSSELSGGAAQLQSYCRVWATEGAKLEKNLTALAKQGIYTCEPRAILIIGRTGQLDDDLDRISSFELFRRNLQNPEIITYDELLARAKFMLRVEENTADESLS